MDRETMVREALLLTFVERHHMLDRDDVLQFYKGCVPCWIRCFRTRFETVRYSWFRTTRTHPDDQVTGYDDYEGLRRDIHRFACQHVDEWIDTKTVGWSPTDEGRLRWTFYHMNCLQGYLEDVEYERRQDVGRIQRIQPQHYHLFDDGGRLKIAFDFNQ
jgi:hypothetical protein